mgnify:FL=1
MPILKYVPPVMEITDNRSADGGYYEAICDICGTMFYPVRSNARYCCNRCINVDYRKRLVSGEVKKKGGAAVKKTAVPGKPLKDRTGERFIGIKAVYRYLRKKTDTHGHRVEILETLKNLKPDEPYIFKGIKIERKSSRVYES